MAFRGLEDIRAWRLSQQFKVAVYRLIESTAISSDPRLRQQLREAAAGAASQVSEGFGRFDPADFARFIKMARASLIECKTHLLDAYDRGYIPFEVHLEHCRQADDALREMVGLLDYLQSPEAKQNAERIRQERIRRRQMRRQREAESGTKRER